MMHRTTICLRSAIVLMALVACEAAYPSTYFVNDASTNGDVYTTAAGNDGNAGTNAAAPKFSVTNLLATYTLTQGDVVLIDSGFYSDYTVTLSTSGVATNYIVIKGSTNATGTVFDRRTNTANVIDIFANYVRLMDLTVRGGQRGVSLVASANCDLVGVVAVSNSSGFYGASASSHRFLHCVAARNTIGFDNFNSGNVWDYGVSWSNGTAFFPATAGTLSISNSIIVGGTAHSVLPNAADYNIYWQTTPGGGAKSIADIQATKGNSFRSTMVNPGLVNPAGLDFHPTSPAGRYERASQAFVTTDTVFSAAIDFGDPSRSFTNEPAPNGPRVNVGTFGDTFEASKSQTSAWLMASSFNDGGELIASGNLCWVYGGAFAPTSTVTIQYSPDSGAAWSNIATGVRVTNALYAWVATSAVSSLEVLWRLVSDGDTNLFDACNTNFILRSSTSTVFKLYVNDDSTVGDVYTSVAGSPTNSGLATNHPMRTVQGILNTYDLGPGDTIYVDTGVYTNPVVISSDDQGSAAGFMTIQGSTNYAVGQTIFAINNSGTDVFGFNGVSFVQLKNLAVRSGRYGVNLSVSSDCRFEFVNFVSNLVGIASAAALNNNFQHCSIAKNGTGLQAGNTGWTWEHGVSWSNAVAFSITATAISMSNSVIVGGTAFNAGVSPDKSDHNVYWQTLLGGSFNTLSDLQKLTGHDLHSTVANPAFANGGGIDFHPRSEAGRFDPSLSTYVIDTNTSILVDTGNPAHPYTNEPAPNGGRLNIGYYGDTAEASKSKTNAWLAALSYNDGGTISAPGDVVYWTGGNLSNFTVRIELSSDSGDSWQVVQTNLPATNGVYTWANTNFGSSGFARWRVVLESNTNVFDATDADVTFKSGPFFYYLNDTNLVGDVYTTAIGSDTNLGTSAGKPKLTLQSLLDSHDIEPSDVIFIDTGRYKFNVNQVITALDAGSATNHVYLRGSSNMVDGGSVFDRQFTNAAAYALHLNGASYLDIQDITFANAGTGVRVEGGQAITLTRTYARNCIQYGWHVRNASGVAIDRSVALSNDVAGLYIEGTEGVKVDNSVLWKNPLAGIRVDSGTVLVSNSVIVASGPSAYGYYAGTVTNVFGDYNDVHPDNSAAVGFIASLGQNADTLSSWSGLTTQDIHSISANPLFADPDGGDFHPKTALPVGRYFPGLGYVATDAETSPLIDAGNPAASYTNEPAPNGNRVNIGLYGNTAEASKGRTNRWLSVATHRAGGWARGTSVLHWVAGNYSPTGTVKVEVTADGGVNWTVLTNGIRATNEMLLWNTRFTNDSPACLWSIADAADTNIGDRTTNFFAIRNTNLLVYVNNDITTNDVFTTAPGLSNNWRASSSAPIDSLEAVFRLFDLEPGDRVLVDSGPYTNLVNILIARMDAGSSNARVQVTGSTTGTASTVAMYRPAPTAGVYGLVLENAGWISISNVALVGANSGVFITNSQDIALSVRSQNSANNGILAYDSSRLDLSRLVVANNQGAGIALKNVVGAMIGNSIIWSNAGPAISLTGCVVTVSNTVIAAGAGGTYAYDVATTSSVIRADYNDVFLLDTARVARVGSTSYKNLSQWQQAFGNDIHSLSHDALFASASAGDFHLKSQGGRQQPGVGVVTDTVSSLAIDAADPQAVFSAEPVPNGGRMNVGLFGNTAQESRSPTNGWLVALTLSDGGSIRNTNSIYWVAGGTATDDFVYIDYSYDEGATWTNIASNVAASAGSVVWTTTTFITSTRGIWRIVSQSDTNLADHTDELFALNNGALTYYVNDNSTAGDVYTLAVGNSANDGLQPSTPKQSIEGILANYDVGPGDRILVDTGNYPGNSTLLIGQGVAGSPTNRFVIQGSTNAAAGGTVLNRAGANPGLHVLGTEGIALRYLVITNALRGVRIEESTNCLIEGIRTEGGITAFEVRNAPSNVIRQCVGYEFIGTGVWSAVAGDLRVEDSFMYTVGRSGVCIRVDSGQISVSNCVFWAEGAPSVAYSLGLSASIASDYNDFFLTNGAYAARQEKSIALNVHTIRNIVQVSRLVRDLGLDRHSLSHDPGFAGASTRDFHPSSIGGRYSPSSGTFVTNVFSSVLIDAGDPNASYVDESIPNGTRRNVGLFGGTGEASRTATNTFITCVSLNDGGRAEGTNVVLYWIARGDATGKSVRLEYSPNGITNWVAIATSVPAASATYVWNTTSFTSSALAAWRIMNPTNFTEYDRSDAPFALRNQPLTFFVNDASTNGDVYSTAGGASTNSGALPGSPKSSLQDILNTWDLEAGDTVYIDTGSYTNNGELIVTDADGGDSTNRVLFLGSTNSAAGGTVFDRMGILNYENEGVEWRNITLVLSTNSGSQTGFNIERSTNVVVRNVNVRNGSVGFRLSSSYDVRMYNCSAAGMRTNGFLSLYSFGSVWQSGVLWSNTFGMLLLNGSSVISNSVLATFGSASYGIYVVATDLKSDFNDFFTANGAIMGVVDAFPEPLVYDSLSRWARDTGWDRHSLNLWPDFADPSLSDFHLRSQAGRYAPTSGTFVADGATSPLVDAGDPAAPFANEPSPNGGRINIGIYGNSSEASMTPTNAVLTVASLNDGGRADGTNVLLYWVARGAATSAILRIEVSPDGGSTWQVVASNVPAGSGSYTWDATSFTTTVLAVWRITSQSTTSITDQSDMPFAVRNAPVSFYVNDSSTNGDVYCASVGSQTNLGLTASAPLPTLALVLSAYDLEAGDTVFMDTGVYSSQVATTIGQFDSAGNVSGAVVTIQGSTNLPAGGTVINGGGGSYALTLETAINVSLRNLVISNASVAVRLFRSHGSSLDWVSAKTSARGFEVDRSDGVRFRRCVARESQNEGVFVSSSGDLRWLNGVLWSNGTYGFRLSSANVVVSNSVIAVFGTNSYAYHISGGNIGGDYNDIYLQRGAWAGFRSDVPDPLYYETVSKWVRGSTQDIHSLTHDPGFQDAAAGDFHLRSTAGRYVVTSGTFVVTDTNASLLIDAADPAAAFGSETSPNGGRMNIGLYGDTLEASCSPTSALFTAVSLNDGGRAEGAEVLLYWVARGGATAHPVRLEYSADEGTTWQQIATNIPATNRSYTWNSLFFTSSVRSLWRVISEVDSNLADRCDQLFALRNGPLYFYVNDGVTNGDVYSLAVGSATNLGATPELPSDAIETILNAWDLEPGDRLFVDTGTYPLANPITISQFDGGLRTNVAAGQVTIQGSTNQAFGGSLLTTTKSKDGIVLNIVRGLALRDLTIRGAKVGVSVNGSHHSYLQFVRSEQCIDGMLVADSDPVEFRNCSSISCDDRGLISMGGLARTVWQNGLLWSNKQGAAVDSGALEVRNSILGGFGDGAFALVFKVTGVLTSDYNNIVLERGAYAGASVVPNGFLGGTTRYETVASWLENVGQDVNTFTFDPMFADPSQGDYHLMTKGGRYDPFSNAVVTDAVSSVLIDGGDPSTDYSAEPQRNGGRVNIDLYGGTWQASRTPTNGWLAIISLNDGGDVSGTNVELRFFAGWVATGHLVYADYSPNNGETWTNIFTNHPASSNVFIWNSTNYPRSATARWRITDQVDPTVYDTNNATFVLRTGGIIPYYVNDDSLVGDVYCTAVGNDLNSGTYPTSPVRNIQQILSTNKLQPRDFVFVDTGTYTLTNSITITDQDGGKGTNELIEIDGVFYPARVIFVGSTNTSAGGSIVDGQGLPLPAFSLQGARSVELRNFRVINADVGVAIAGSLECVVDSVRAENNRLGFSVSQGSSNIMISHSIARNNLTNGFLNAGANVIWDHGVIWDNPNTVVLEAGESTFRNSAFNANGSGGRVFRLSPDAVITNSDYNNFIMKSGALLGERERVQGGNDVYVELDSWAALEGQDSNSLSHQPLFADEASGDFHLQSGTGRFVPGTGYATDTVFSPMIDLGDPAAAFTNEPAPNGGILDMGAYGNTGESSLSQTNPWLLAISLNAGGVVSAPGELHWAYGNMPATALVSLAVSVDGGIEYQTLASNIPVAAKSLAWAPCSFPLSSLARWKIVSDTYSNVSDEIDGVFVIKCDVLDIYVNDSSLAGDMFCTAVGNPTNSGLSPADPLLDPGEAFSRYYVSAGDTIYIDTGQYVINNPNTGMVLGVGNRGTPTAPIVIHGSTNDAAGGTVIDRANPVTGIGLLINQSRYVEVDHIKLKGGSVGLLVNDSQNCRMDWIESYSNAGAGFSMSFTPSITARYCAAWNNGGYGLSVGEGSALTFENGVLWSNSSGSVSINGATLALSNSILHSVSPTSYLYAVNGADLHSDFNLLYRPISNGFTKNLFNNQVFANLKKWQDTFGVDQHSVMVDPLLANPGAGDFHLRSQAGRFQGFSLVHDTNTSWAIDAGGFNSPYVNEPLPNGSRHNVGLYGNTVRASLSATGTPELLAVRLNDGGTVEGPIDLYWLYRGIPPTNRIRLELSLDDGASWRIIVTNLSVSDQGYLWANTNPSSPSAVWRIVSESDSNLFDAIDTNFYLRVGPVNYYVNDANTNGDVYTKQSGSPFNSGLSNGIPLDSIQTVIDKYDVSQGDVIYVDTGVYTSRVLMGAGDFGVATQRLTIVGSTNGAAGGTILRMADAASNALAGAAAIRLEFTQGIDLQNLAIENSDIGFDLYRCSLSRIADSIVRSSGRAGISLALSSANLLERVVVTRMDGVGIDVDNCSGTMVSSVIWSNASHAVSLNNAFLQISNSVLSAHESGVACLYVSTNSFVGGDYNCYTLSSGALYAVVSEIPIEGLPQLTAEGGTTQDIHSLSVDPMFADPANDDFHLRSQSGRFDPAIQSFVTTDVVTSLLIDTGDAGATYTNEPAPNGSRRNIGLHGDTVEASKSRTNAWLLAITASAGGNIEGSVYLAWAWGGAGIASTNNVLLEYSFNNGITWTNIGTSLVSSVSYLWQSDFKEAVTNEKWPSSPLARWRLTLVGNTNITDTTDSNFALHNKPFFYYVNDTSTVNDVYATAIGSDTNFGLFPYEPMLTLANLLQVNDVQGTDTILLDTGHYVIEATNLFTIGPGDQGSTNKYVVVQGSTNFAAGGTRIGKGLTLSDSNLITVAGSFVELRCLRLLGGGVRLVGGQTICTNLVLTNGGISVQGNGSIVRNVRTVNGGVSLTGTNITLRQVQVVDGGAQLLGANILVENSVVSITNGPAISLFGESITLRNNTIVSKGTAFRLINSTTFATLENNILVADGSGQEAFCILREDGFLLSDYNDLVARNGAWIGNANGKWEKLGYWQRESLLDTHSLAVEPLFADEAGLDFHLKSKAGRFLGGSFVIDGVHSPAIDAGKPSTSVGSEVEPNGSRINLGAYGGTPEASKSLTNVWLNLLTANDGGVLKGTNVTLRWNSAPLGTSMTFTIQYSPDAGSTWTTIVAGLSPTNAQYTWDSTLQTSSLNASLRIFLVSDTNVVDQTDTPFALRNAPLNFYVNDTSTVGDVFTTTNGSPSSTGRTPQSPLHSIQAVLTNYDVEALDTIYVDTGYYPITQDVTVIWSDGGDDAGNLMIRGSTNVVAGGTVIVRNDLSPGSDVFDVKASHVTLRDMALRMANRGVFFDSNRYSVAERLLIYSNLSGVVDFKTIGVTNQNLRIWNNGAGIDIDGARTTYVENCTLVGNYPYGVRVVLAASNVIQGNIFYLSATNSRALADVSNELASAFIDYNIYCLATNGTSIDGSNVTLAARQRAVAKDYRSSVTNPLFQDVASGDFHVKSTVGRFQDNVNGFVVDAVDSWAIDRGNPYSVFTNEPAVNGNRLNIGAFGNTEYASKGRTNLSVEMRVANSPATLSTNDNPMAVTWSARNTPSGATVRVEYSGDNGLTWIAIATNVQASQEYVIWGLAPTYNTYNKGLLRVVGEGGNPFGIGDTNNAPIDLFFGEFAINTEAVNTNGNAIVWRGAWGENYQVQYADILQHMNLAFAWSNAVNGVGPNQSANFQSTIGGDFLYVDPTSTGLPYRLYRVILEQYEP